MTTDTEHYIEQSINGDVMTITLNRPDKLNAFNAELVENLHTALKDAKNKNMRAVIFRGHGKGFSGGFDLSTIDQSTDGDLLLRFVRVEQLLQAVYHAPFTTIALVHGPCYGAAADLVVACHQRIASQDARFRMPGVQFGLVLGTRRLTNIVGANNAQKLLVREKPFGADEALATGFINTLCEQDKWQDTIDNHLTHVRPIAPETLTQIASRMTYDTRSDDLSALVQSVTQSSIKSRILAYLETMNNKRS